MSQSRGSPDVVIRLSHPTMQQSSDLTVTQAEGKQSFPLTAMLLCHISQEGMQNSEKLKSNKMGGVCVCVWPQSLCCWSLCLCPLGNTKLLEEQHPSRHRCRKHRPEEKACPPLPSFSAWAAHDQTGFLERPPLHQSLFKSGDNSFDFFVSQHKEGPCLHAQSLV